MAVAPNLTIKASIEWDDDRGVLSTVSELMRHEIEVRARLEDDVLRAAVILELERQGYTVLAPEA